MSTFDYAEMHVVANATHCTFRAKGFGRECHDVATRVLRGNPVLSYSRDERRCERHWAIDRRTATNRGDSWALDRLAKYVRFDAATAKAEAVTAHRAKKVRLADAFWADVVRYATARDLAGLRSLIERKRT